MANMKTDRVKDVLSRLGGAGIAVLAVAGVVGGLCVASATAGGASTAGAGVSVQTENEDKLDWLLVEGSAGRPIEVRGVILEETDRRVKIMVKIGAMEAPQWYDKSDIIDMRRAERSSETGDESGTGTGSGDVGGTGNGWERNGGNGAAAETVNDEANGLAPSVYVIKLDGRMGRDLTPTPLRDAVRKAEQARPDYLIFEVDLGINQVLGAAQEGQFDQLFMVEDFDPIIGRSIEQQWEKKPKRIFWVKNAMGGGAFLPFLGDTIYFHPQGKMGGIGNLQTQMMGVGDKMVVEKQISLRLGHAQGMAIAGGYDPILVSAMAELDFVLSVSFVGGEAVYHRRMPQNIGEILLTDNGMLEQHADNPMDLMNGEGNDVLTLGAPMAEKLGLSKGTARNLDELMFELGIDRNYRQIESDANRVLDQWSRAVSDAERRIPQLVQESNEIRVQGDMRERMALRAQKMSRLRDAIRLIDRYGEALPQFKANRDQLAVALEQLRLDQIADRNGERGGGGGGGGLGTGGGALGGG